MNKQNDPKQRAVVYLRIARAYPDDATAIAHQREGCERIAAEHGLTVVREYADVGRSAVLEQQTELRRLLDELDQRRDASFVVVWNYSRLGRSMTQLNEVVDRIRAGGAEVVTITGVETVERFVWEQQGNDSKKEVEDVK